MALNSGSASPVVRNRAVTNSTRPLLRSIQEAMIHVDARASECDRVGVHPVSPLNPGRLREPPDLKYTVPIVLGSRSTHRPIGVSELVADELATAAVQDRRPPDPACSVLHPPAGRKPLDAAPLWEDPRAYRAARGVSDLIPESCTGSGGNEQREGAAAAVSLHDTVGATTLGGNGLNRRQGFQSGCLGRVGTC